MKITSLLIFGASLLLAAFTFFKKPLLDACYLNLSFYCILALFICWVAVTVNYLIKTGFKLPLFIKMYWHGLLFCLLMTGIIFVTAKPYFRVLCDETNLLAVSKSMLYEKKVDNSTMGEWYYNNYYSFSKEQEKRPFLFPFLTYTVHTLTGYRVENPFVVNFILLFSLLSMVFVVVGKRLNSVCAYCATLLVAAQPVIAQTAASAGFDLLMVVFIVAAFICLYSYLKNPNEDTFILLWVTLLMLANSRYDGLLFILVIIPLLLALKQIRMRFINSAIIYITPFLMLPVFWQRFCLHTNYENPPGVAVFSVLHLIKHSTLFLKTLYNFNYYYPYASLINILGILGGLYFLLMFIYDVWPLGQSNRNFAYIALLCFAAHWVTVNAYYFGNPIQPVSCRFFCLTSLVLSLLCVMYTARLFDALKGNSGVPAIVVSAALFLLYNPVSIENRFSNSLSLPRAYRYEMDFLRKQGSDNILVITKWPGMIAVNNYGAVDFAYATKYGVILQDGLRIHRFEHIYAIQDIDIDMGLPKGREFLPDGFKQRTISELKDGDSFMRISELTL